MKGAHVSRHKASRTHGQAVKRIPGQTMRYLAEFKSMIGDMVLPHHFFKIQAC